MTTAKSKPHAPVPDPLRLLDQAQSRVFDGLRHQIYTARRAVEETERKAEELRKNLAFLEGKARAVAGRVFGDKEIQRQLGTKSYDAKLLALLKKCRQSPWVKYARAGASDEQILLALKVGWPDYSGSAPTRAVSGKYQGDGPSAWIDAESTGGKPTLTGKALAAEARRLLQIPEPKPAAAAAAKKPAAKKPPAKKPAGGGGQGGGGKPAAAAAKPAAKPADKGKPEDREDDVDGEDLDAAGTIKPGVTYAAADLGLPESFDPEAFVSTELRPDGIGALKGTGRIKMPLILRDGRRWAVVGCSVQSSQRVYTFQQVVPAEAWKGDREPWADRRAKHRNKAPEDVPLLGVVVLDPVGSYWVLGKDTDRVHVSVPRERSAEASTAAPASDEERVPVTTLPEHVGKIEVVLTREPDGQYRARLWNKGAPPLHSAGAFPAAEFDAVREYRAEAVDAVLEWAVGAAETKLATLSKAETVNGRAAAAALRKFQRQQDPYGGRQRSAVSGWLAEVQSYLPHELMGRWRRDCFAPELLKSFDAGVKPRPMADTLRVQWSDVPAADAPSEPPATPPTSYDWSVHKDLPPGVVTFLAGLDDSREALFCLRYFRWVRGGRQGADPAAQFRDLHPTLRNTLGPAVLEAAKDKPAGPGPSTGEYGPGHPWYYKLGGEPLPAEKIEAAAVDPATLPPDPAKEPNPKLAKVRLSRAIRSLVEELDRDIVRYRNLVASYGPDCGMREWEGLALKHNHIRSAKGRIAALRALQAGKEPAEVSAPTPATGPAPKAPGQKQTYGQWLSSVRSSLCGSGCGHVEVEDGDAELRGYYDRGLKASAAAGLLRARQVTRDLAAKPTPAAEARPGRPNGGVGGDPAAWGAVFQAPPQAPPAGGAVH